MNHSSSPLLQSLTVPVVVTLLAGGIYLVGQSMQGRSAMPSTITVEGRSEVSVAPDVAIVQFGVTTGRQSTSTRTLEVLTTNMDAVIAAVKANGIEDKDISTQSLWLNPAYDWIDGQQIARGFEATQNLSVKVRDVSVIGKLLTDATEAGANQIGSISFTVDDAESLKDQAREEAVADAREKARTLAEGLGVRLGRIVSYTEGFGGGVSPYPEHAYGMGGGGGDLSVPSGEQEITVVVTVNYEIR